MELKYTDSCRIITPLSPKLEERESIRLEEELSSVSCLKTALDMSYVEDCTFDFVNTIKKYTNLSLFNINSDIFAILISMNLDKKLKLYVSENDFLNNKHQLINRTFNIV